MPPAPASSRAVERALALLSAVSASGDGRTLSELARDTNLAASTALRILRTLQNGGFVRRDANGRFHAGGELLVLAAEAMRNLPVYQVAEPRLQALVDELDETANLGVIDERDRVLYLAQVPSRHPVRHVSWRGRTIPAAGSAIGAALRGEAGAAGYTLRRDRSAPDITAVAAPVRGPDGQIVGAISVTGPTYRVSDRDVERIAAAVVREAINISEEIGARAPRGG